jgi:hypothetical protein
MKSDTQPTSHGRKARNKQGEGTGTDEGRCSEKHQRTAGGGFRGRDELPLWLLRWRRGFLANAGSIGLARCEAIR